MTECLVATTVKSVAFLDLVLQVVIDLRTHLHSFAEGARTDWQNHELLHRELVSGMRTSIDHVECRDWKDHLEESRLAG